jgi:hypothetical protein
LAGEHPGTVVVVVGDVVGGEGTDVVVDPVVALVGEATRPDGDEHAARAATHTITMATTLARVLPTPGRGRTSLKS